MPLPVAVIETLAGTAVNSTAVDDTAADVTVLLALSSSSSSSSILLITIDAFVVTSAPSAVFVIDIEASVNGSLAGTSTSALFFNASNIFNSVKSTFFCLPTITDAVVALVFSPSVITPPVVIAVVTYSLEPFSVTAYTIASPFGDFDRYP